MVVWIDDPLSSIHLEPSNSIPEPVRIVPTRNWAGRYDGGIGGRCITYGSQQVREVVWAPGEREDDLSGQGGGPQEHCVRVAWPAQALWMNLDRKDFGNGAPSWTGSLVRHGRDPSGQYYRRNRYYDATAGRFTQEDPSGLAGGGEFVWIWERRSHFVFGSVWAGCGYDVRRRG